LRLPAIRRWLKFRQSIPCCWFVSPRLVIDDVLLISYHPHYHSHLYLALWPIRFDQICGSFGTHGCYHWGDERFLLFVVYPHPDRTRDRYTPLCVKCPFGRAWLVVPEHVLRSVVGKISEPPNVHSECCLILSPAFLFWLPYRLVRRRAYVGSDLLPVRWVGWVHWLVVVYASLNAGRLIKV